MKRIYLVRHGRQASKLCNVDVELDTIGRRQAECLERRVSQFTVDKIYSSNLKRAVETAQILNAQLKVPYETMEDLKEIDFGLWTGMTEEAIQNEYGDLKEAMKCCKADYSYPSGENGEAVARRAMQCLEKIIQQQEEHVIVVTHGGLIRSVVSKALQMNQKDKRLLGINLENTSITELRYNEENGLFYLERFNDYSHLEGQSDLLRCNW